MPPSLSHAVVSAPLKRVESRDPADHNKVESGDLSIEEAKILAGIIVVAVLRETDAALKELGDKGQVSKWTSGKENPNLAKLLQKVEGRKAMLKALARSVKGTKVHTTIEFEEAV